MKFTILMPTYNDSESIQETLNSLINQSYENWELIIVDDGSSDSTKKVIQSYIKEKKLKHKIKYIYQENSDQLNALKNASQYISGDYVYILHSDDLLANDNVLKDVEEYLKKNNNLDGIIADLTIINENSEVTGKQKVNKFKNKAYIMPMQLLWLGRNLYVDSAFHKKEVFLNEVYNNYLKLNGPFWLNLNIPSLLDIRKVNIPFIKYRIHSGNYINNEIGKLCVINGEIRVVTRLLKFYTIPFYELQYLKFRTFNKLGLLKVYRPIYLKKETTNKAKVIRFVLNKRFSNFEIEKNIFLNGLLKFYENYGVKRSLEFNFDKNIPIYYGSDMRIFNKKILDNTLNDFYITLMEEMQKGFDEIIVSDDKKKNIMTDITKFLCIYPYVKITIKK